MLVSFMILLENFSGTESQNTDPKMKNRYFEITDGSKNLPLNSIIEREPANPSKLRRARALMEKARDGTGPKRPPIKIVDQGDGTYKVMDGNTTLHVLRELGESRVVVEIQDQNIGA